MSLRSKLRLSDIYTESKVIEENNKTIFRTLAYSPRKIPKDTSDVAVNTDYIGHVLLEAMKMSQNLKYCGIILIPTKLTNFNEKLLELNNHHIGFYCEKDPFYSWSYYYKGNKADAYNITDLLLYAKDKQRESDFFKELCAYFKCEHKFNNSTIIIPIELIHGLVFDI